MTRRISWMPLCECSVCLASEQPDNFKITARPGLATPEWPNVSGWSGQSRAGTMQVACGRRRGQVVCPASSFPVPHTLSILRTLRSFDVLVSTSIRFGSLRAWAMGGAAKKTNKYAGQSICLLGAAVSRRWRGTERERGNLRTCWCARGAHQAPGSLPPRPST